MTVKELMSVNICFVTADADVTAAAALMKKYDIGLIPVCDQKGCLLGLVTDRDIVLRALSSKEGIEKKKVRHIMTEEIVSVTPMTDIHDAALVFSEKKVRRLPVLDNGRLVGILSLSDLSGKRIFLAEVGEIMGNLAKV